MFFLETFTRKKIFDDVFLCAKGGIKSEKIRAVIFGTGGMADEFIKLYGCYLDIVQYFDNYAPTSVKNCVPVTKPHFDKEIYSSSVIIIASSNYFDICNQLLALGYDLYAHHLNASFFINPITPYRFSIEKNAIPLFFSLLNDCNVDYACLEPYGDHNAYESVSDLEFFANERIIEMLNNHQRLCYEGECSIDVFVHVNVYPNNSQLLGVYNADVVQKALMAKNRLADGKWGVSDDIKQMVSSFQNLLQLERYYKSCRKHNFLSMKVSNTFICSSKSKINENIVSVNGEVDNVCQVSLDWLRHYERQQYYMGRNTDGLKSFLTCDRVHNKSELVVIVLREIAVKYGFESFIKNFFESVGVKFVDLEYLNSDERQVMEKKSRGGNWRGTKNDIIAGGPAALLVFEDVNPIRPEYYMNERAPHCYRSNVIYDQKVKLRKILTEKIENRTNLNFVHTPDDECEAIEYIRYSNRLLDKLYQRINRN